MSDSEGDKVEITEIVESCDENAVAVEAISEKLTEVSNLAEELDQTLESAQQDCAITTTPTVTVATTTSVTSSTDVPIVQISDTKEVCILAKKKFKKSLPLIFIDFFLNKNPSN